MTDPTTHEAAHADAIAEFDPTVAVAEGVTVLEASAGTGKTHAVSSLVVAQVAEGRPLDQLLVVTFTRKAAGELAERLRRLGVEGRMTAGTIHAIALAR